MSMSRLVVSALVATLSLSLLSGCDGQSSPGSASQPAAGLAVGGAAPAASPGELKLPEVDDSKLPFALQTKLGAARREALANPGQADKVAALGAIAYVHGFPELAVACLSHVARLQPRFDRWHCLGLAYEAADNNKEALRAYEQALATNKYLPAQTRSAIVQIQLDRSRALALFEKLMAEEQRSPVPHSGLGYCALAAGDLDGAARHFRRALELGPKYGPAHAGLAKVLSAQGQADAAAAALARAGADTALRPIEDPVELGLRKLGYDVEMLRRSAHVLIENQRFAEAEKELQQALEIDEHAYLSRALLGAAYGQQGRLPEAARELDASLADPQGKDYVPAKLDRARVAFLQGDLALAEKLLTEVLEAEPNNGEALKRYVPIKMQQNALPQGLERVQAALERAPQDVALHLAAAEIYHRLGQKDTERALLQKTIQLDPKSADAHYQLGILAYESGDAAGAQQAWLTALQHQPDAVPARINAAMVYEERGRYAEAIQLLRAGLEAGTASPLLQNHLAWLLATCPDAAQRQPEEAVKLAEQANQAQQFLDHATLDTLAAAYAAVGRFDDAQRTIAEAIRLAEGVRTAAGTQSVEEYQRRQKLYEAGQAYVEQR